MLHLTQVNPQIPGLHNTHKQWQLPRVSSAMPQSSASAVPTCGTSAFAFQGTNAHVIMQQAPAVPVTAAAAIASSGQQAIAWAREQHWVAPPLPLLLSACQSINKSSSYGRGSMAVVFEADLGSVRAAFLRQFIAGQEAVMPLAGLVGLCQDALELLTSHRDLSGEDPSPMVFITL